MNDNPLSDQFDSILNGQLPDNYGVDFSPSTFTGSAGASTPSAGPSAVSYAAAGASVLGGIGSYLSGVETQQADEYNASLALIQGQFQVDQIDSEETQTLSTQKAMYAKAGVELSGSVLDTALSTATAYEYDKNVATYNAQSQANMDIYEGKVAKSQGEIGLASGLLSGASKLL